MQFGPDENPRLIITLTVIVTLLMSVGFIMAGDQLEASPGDDHANHEGASAHALHEAMAENLNRTAIVSAAGHPLIPPMLEATNGVPMSSQLEGRWSLLFFGFTSCPHVCPTTLNTLARAAGTQGSPLSDDRAQVLFISVDPETDTRDRIESYLEKFDNRFVGYTGMPEAIEGFSDQVGAAYSVTEEGIDHSTSIFVVDPNGRPAGVLLRPTDDRRLLKDLEIVQRESMKRSEHAAVAQHAGNHH